MNKNIKLTESELIKIIKKILNEDKFYAPISKDNQINTAMSFEDKKELYRLVVSKKDDDPESMNKLKNKISEIVNKLSEELGEKNRPYIKEFLRKMVGALILKYANK